MQFLHDDCQPCQVRCIPKVHTTGETCTTRAPDRAFTRTGLHTVEMGSGACRCMKTEHPWTKCEWRNSLGAQRLLMLTAVTLTHRAKVSGRGSGTECRPAEMVTLLTEILETGKDAKILFGP